MEQSIETDLHHVEMLAAKICEEQATAKGGLCRLIRAEAKIINARDPEQFKRKPLHHGDEEGCWDNTYPPKQTYSDYSGPRLKRIYSRVTEDTATEGGFYYRWRRTTTDGGLLVSPAGELYTSDETGTGQFGQFAAHPGNCGVSCAIEYNSIGPEPFDLHILIQAEKELRAIAFPAKTTTASERQIK